MSGSDDLHRGASEFREYPGRTGRYTPPETQVRRRPANQAMLRKLRRGILGIKLFGIVLIITLASYIASQVWPVDPYKIEDYSVTSESLVCPNSPVQATVTRYAEPGSKIERINTFTQWVNVDTDRGTGFTEYPVVPDSDYIYGRITQVSPIIRDAPSEPGRFEIETRYIVSTRLFFWKRTVEKTYLSGPILTVRVADSSACPGG